MKKLIKNALKTLVILFILLNIICAFHAYKLTHFYSDVAKPKKPEELTVTEKISAALFGVSFPKQPSVDSCIAFPHKQINITTTDGIVLEAWHSIADSLHTKGTVLFFHGHGGNKDGLLKEAIQIYEMGYNLLLVDFRAHGNSQGNVCTIGYEESKDVRATFDYIKATGEKNIILYGTSLGAATILKAIAADSVVPAKIILDMPFGTLKQAVNGRIKMMHLPQEPIATLFTFWGGVEQGFWAFNLQPQEYAKQVQCPVLLQWGANDARVTRQETETIFANLSTKNKTYVEYKNSAHQSFCKNEFDQWHYEVGRFLK